VTSKAYESFSILGLLVIDYLKSGGSRKKKKKKRNFFNIDTLCQFNFFLFHQSCGKVVLVLYSLSNATSVPIKRATVRCFTQLGS